MPANPIYKFKAELLDTELSIWREFEVTNNMPMSRLGYVLMSIFNMEGSHLFAFEVPYKEDEKPDVDLSTIENQFERNAMERACEIYRVEIPNPYDDFISPVKVLNATKTKLSKVLKEVNEIMIFNYDFGDDWNIKLTLQKIYTDSTIHGREFPRVLDGAGFGIIDDCGGVGGLENLSIAFQNKSGEDYEQYSEWLCRKEFDITQFNLKHLNYIVKHATAIYKDSYEE